MLKIVSYLNGFSVRQLVTALGKELQLQLNNLFFFKKNLLFKKKIKKCFWEKMIFWLIFLVIFRVRQPVEDNLKKYIFRGRRPD